jgi:hypothetical protein
MSDSQLGATRRFERLATRATWRLGQPWRAWRQPQARMTPRVCMEPAHAQRAVHALCCAQVLEPRWQAPPGATRATGPGGGRSVR